jgi:regulator of protease activity HflC (stomatin/prohibitin superfamily)
MYRIVDCHKAVYAVDDVRKTMENTLNAAVRSAVVTMTLEQTVGVEEAVQRHVLTKFGSFEKVFGVSIQEVRSATVAMCNCRPFRVAPAERVHKSHFTSLCAM